VAVRSKVWVYGRSVSGIISSNSSEGMDVSLFNFLHCIGSGLCGHLITRPEKSHGVSMCVCMYVYVCVCVCVCDLETLTSRQIV
jgi:hypothetical protein